MSAEGNTTRTSIALDIGYNDADYGLLAGPAFSTTYAVSGLFAVGENFLPLNPNKGQLADRHHRVALLVGGLVMWSSMTSVAGPSARFCLLTLPPGLVHSFWQFLLVRLGLGLGEAFCGPPSYSLLSDYFPPSKRSTANGIFAFGVYLGGGLASISSLADERFGWRVHIQILFLI
jgi:MFS family permease